MCQLTRISPPSCWANQAVESSSQRSQPAPMYSSAGKITAQARSPFPFLSLSQATFGCGNDMNSDMIRRVDMPSPQHSDRSVANLTDGKSDAVNNSALDQFQELVVAPSLSSTSIGKAM